MVIDDTITSVIHASLGRVANMLPKLFLISLGLNEEINQSIIFFVTFKSPEVLGIFWMNKLREADT